MTDKERVFEVICRNDVSIMNCYPILATAISDITGISLYKTRKILHELKESEFIEFIRDYEPDKYSYEGEFEDEGFFYCGWKLTMKGRCTFTFEKIQAEEMERIERFLGI